MSDRNTKRWHFHIFIFYVWYFLKLINSISLHKFAFRIAVKDFFPSIFRAKFAVEMWRLPAAFKPLFLPLISRHFKSFTHRWKEQILLFLKVSLSNISNGNLVCKLDEDLLSLLKKKRGDNSHFQSHILALHFQLIDFNWTFFETRVSHLSESVL